jgi:hypothetical protein
MKQMTLGRLKKQVDDLLKTYSDRTPVAVNIDTLTAEIQDTNVRDITGLKGQSVEIIDGDGFALLNAKGEVKEKRMIVLFGYGE